MSRRLDLVDGAEVEIDASLNEQLSRSLILIENLERAKRFEPSTPTLANRTGHFPLRSTTCADEFGTKQT